MCARLNHNGNDGNSLLIFKSDYNNVCVMCIQFNMHDRPDLKDYFSRLLSTMLFFNDNIIRYTKNTRF